MDDDTIALVARALAHPARVRILRLLADQTECRGAEVFSELPLAQSTISQHLAVLKEARLITSQPVGTGMVYCLVPARLHEFLEIIGEITTCAADCVPGQGEC